MNSKYFFLSLLFLLIISCKDQQTIKTIAKVDADSLIVNIEKYGNTKVEVEGKIIHICGVDQKKMKLKTNNGGIIKIVAKDSSAFDKSYNKTDIKVIGLVEESSIDKAYIDKIEKDKTILCHIDNTPCKASDWIDEQIKSGKADEMVKQKVEKLRNQIHQSNNSKIITVTILADSIAIID